MYSSDEIDYRVLFESLPGLYMILRPDLTILTVSQAYAKATLTKVNEIRDRYLFEVFPDNPDDPSASGESNLMASLRQVKKLGIQDSMAVQKYDIRRADGSFEEKYWSCLNKPVLNSQGELLYIIHRAEDITSFIRLKNQEAEQGLINKELQQKVEVMQSDVYNRAQEIQRINSRLIAEADQRHHAELALQEKTKLLEKANKEMESFSYSVSHDLRAPLRIIDGFIKILTDDYTEKLDGDGQRVLNVISTNVRRMGQLIDDLLNLSKMGRKEPEKYKVDMEALLYCVLQEQLPERGRYTIKQGTLLPAFCDRNLLYQVWTNLMSNAIKYSSNTEQPVIEIQSCAAANEIIYSVRDNGAGFNMKYASKLFGVFQRLHSSDEFEGTGVGLALVQQIVNRHGGRVWAEAEQGNGATFYFSLPVVASTPAVTTTMIQVTI